MLGEAKRGRTWPEHVVRAFEYWLYCDVKEKNTAHLVRNLMTLLDLTRDETCKWIEDNSDNYQYYVQAVHPYANGDVISPNNDMSFNKSN